MMREEAWKDLHAKVKVGDRIKSTVSNVTDFGIFVQIVPGVDGLVHVSDVSWTERINRPSDLYQRGQEVDAIILGIDDARKRVSLGIKQLQEDPWSQIEEQYPIDSVVEGEVAALSAFGAFVTLPSGVKGLVHISELADRNVNRVEDVLQVGQKAQFKVIKVSKKDHKLGLSLKQV
jgi:small subunit ribosomal protein S1